MRKNNEEKKEIQKTLSGFICQKSGRQRLIQRTCGIFKVKYIKELANEKTIIARP
jgi:hypothetical protein